MKENTQNVENEEQEKVEVSFMDFQEFNKLDSEKQLELAHKKIEELSQKYNSTILK